MIAAARFFRRGRRFWGERGGAAAVEFALMAPLLIGMYFISLEASSAIKTKRVMSRAAAMIGNITAQQENVTKDNLKDIIAIGQALLAPYNRGDDADVIVTGIRMNADDPPKPTVAWSYSSGGEKPALPKDSPVTVPEELLYPDSSLVLVESELSYAPIITQSSSDAKEAGIAAAFSDITMSETHYERPRYTEVRCTNC